MKRLIQILAIACLTSPCQAETLLEVDFSKDRTIWGVRKPNPAMVGFGGDAMFMTVAEQGVQPVAAYTGFGPIVLQDGDSLRLTVQVASAHPEPRPRDIRIALGYAPHAITGLSQTLAVPLSGYFIALPSGGAANNPRISWVDNEGEDINFFNRVTSNIGNPRLTGGASVGINWTTVVFEIRREGNRLAFAGNLGEVDIAPTARASGDHLIEGFQFNTVGLACAFAAGHKVAFRNLKLEWIQR
jgi:hypothetical protein